MLTLTAKSETIVNDFNDLSIRSDEENVHFDSHKVSMQMMMMMMTMIGNSVKFYVRVKIKEFLK